MKRQIILYLFCFALTTISCQKEDSFSDVELITQELQSAIKDNSIERVINLPLDQSWANTMILGDYGKNYKFQGQFIYIEGVYYNLNNLIIYRIDQKSSENGIVKFLLLSFF
jgi:hypothetical protein